MPEAPLEAIVAVIVVFQLPNLFLHFSLIVGDCKSLSESGRRERGRFYPGETFWAFLIDTLINGAIVVVAVAK